MGTGAFVSVAGAPPDDRERDRSEDAYEDDLVAQFLKGGTYKGVAEQRLSPAEERFERGRRSAGLILAPLGFLIMILLPLGLEDQKQHTLAAVLVLVVILWITEAVPIPVGGLIGVALLVLLGVGSGDDVLAPFGSSTIFVFIGAFIIAQAMLEHGVARRFAFRMLAMRWVGKSTRNTVVAFGLIAAILSAFVSNTATVAMLLPTAIAILATLVGLMKNQGEGGQNFDPRRMRVGVALMLMLAYGAGVGGLLTPVGSPPNLIGRGLIEEATDETITFFDWILAAAPVCIAMFIVLAIVLLLLNKPEVKRLEGIEDYVADERRKLGSMSRKEKNTLIAFGTAVTLWIVPGIVGIIAGDTSKTYEDVVERLDEGIVAVLAASLLFLLPTDWKKREFTLTWGQASRIDWGTILLFGSGIIFGSMLQDTGLAETIGKSSSDALGISSTLAITIFAVLLAILISETTSNTASASIVVPIVLPIASAAGVDPFVPALAATFAASFGFMLPVSTPQNAIVYGSGVVPITKMLRSGAVFDVLGALLILALLPLMVSVLNLG